MSIQRITRRDGSVRYLARVYVDGHQRGAAFPTCKEAKLWESETVSARDRGRYIAPESGSTPCGNMSSSGLTPCTCGPRRWRCTAHT